MKTTILGYQKPTVPPTVVVEYSQASPALLGVGDELWVAWTDTQVPRNLHVTHGHALTPDAFHESPSAIVASGMEPVVGLAQLDGKFYVAWSTPGAEIHLAASADGHNWNAAATLSSAHAEGGVSLTAHAGGLYIVYRDGASGQAAITAWSPSLPAFFMPTTLLGIPTDGVPALASVEDPLAWPALHVAVATAGKKIVASRCFNGLLGDLAPGFREVVGLSGDAVTLAPRGAHNPPGLAIGVISDRHSIISTAGLSPDAPFVTVERSDPLDELGVDLPRLATVDGEIFLGYSDLDAQVVLACYVHACTLGADPRIAQPCDPDACPPDPRLVCAIQPQQHIGWKPASIENAQKGDLILSPADGTGVIGVLLGALQPEQIYDHMGIMVEDKRVIRHCTESKDRLTEKGYYTGWLVTDPEPTNGVRPDHITYGWPGIIQQTIEDAFYTGLRGPYNTDWAMDPPLEDDPPTSDADFLAISPEERQQRYPNKWESLKFVDPEDHFPDLGENPTPQHYRYTIRNIPSDPAARNFADLPDRQFLWPIVVRPPKAAETGFPWVRPLLRRVADAAINLRAHYRFFCYSRSAISVDGSKDPPPKGASYWNSITHPVQVQNPPPPPPPIDPDNPAVPPIPEPTYHSVYVTTQGADWAVGTHPMVCSTFVWASVRAAERGLDRPIVLEGEPEPLNNIGKPHRPIGSQDGLYAYTAQERQDSAFALHSALVRGVRESLEEAESGVVGLGASFFVWTSDMADDVATQTLNAFTFDRADEVDDHLWEHPGTGDAVGPDDILLQWDAPSAADGEGFHGLYGDQEPADLEQGTYAWVQDYKYQLADGMAHVRVHTYFTDPTTGTPRFVKPLVSVGCESGYADDNGRFSALIGAGLVLVKANTWDPVLGVWLKYQGGKALTEGINNVDVELLTPPLWRRRILWTGETHIYHNPDIGNLQVRTTPFASNYILAWDPDVLNNDPASNVKGYMTNHVISGKSASFDGHYVTYSFTIDLRDDNSIDYDGEFCFFVDGDKEDDQTRKFSGKIPADGGQNFKYEAYHDAFLDSHDYGRVLLTINNEWAKY